MKRRADELAASTAALRRRAASAPPRRARSASGSTNCAVAPLEQRQRAASCVAALSLSASARTAARRVARVLARELDRRLASARASALISGSGSFASARADRRQHVLVGAACELLGRRGTRRRGRATRACSAAIAPAIVRAEAVVDDDVVERRRAAASTGLPVSRSVAASPLTTSTLLSPATLHVAVEQRLQERQRRGVAARRRWRRAPCRDRRLRRAPGRATASGVERDSADAAAAARARSRTARSTQDGQEDHRIAIRRTTRDTRRTQQSAQPREPGMRAGSPARSSRRRAVTSCPARPSSCRCRR